MAKTLINKTEFSIESLTARREHSCCMCNEKIRSGVEYMKITSRKNDERFPVELKLCKKHNLTVVPLGVIWQR